MKMFVLSLLLLAHCGHSAMVTLPAELECKIQFNSSGPTVEKKQLFYFNGNVIRGAGGRDSSMRHVFRQLGDLKLQLCRPSVSGNTANLDDLILRHLSLKMTYIGTVYFERGSDVIESGDTLRIKQALYAGSYRGLVMVGRADSTGQSRPNLDLSFRRARNALTHFAKDVSSAIIALGDRQTPQEKAVTGRNNRRVDIYAFSYPVGMSVR